jgi:hypothetical protein
MQNDSVSLIITMRHSTLSASSRWKMIAKTALASRQCSRRQLSRLLALSTIVPSRSGGGGRGLGCSKDELNALVVQENDISSDPMVASGQTTEKYADRIRAALF